jgi:hypothetical protein
MTGSENPLIYMLRKENASSLGITGERLQRALDDLRAWEGEHGSGGARHAELEKIAADRLFAYVVQREACGLFLHDGVLAAYQVPSRLIARMGAS